jgi:hypothetical protein
VLLGGIRLIDEHDRVNFRKTHAGPLSCSSISP